MYTDHYRLREKPFNLNSSERFLYLGEVHREALALLTYGIMERKGFILLTGEVGTGKTTMVRALLSRLDENVHYVHITNPVLSPMELMDYLSSSVFKGNGRFASKADFLIEFERFLRDCSRRGKIFLLVIDEAQKLSTELLEEIRLLSNMENLEERLVNVFLVGQPELNSLLNRMECRPLRQRISIRYHIEPLDFGSTREYLETRLKAAGAEDVGKLFPMKSIRVLHRLSGGYPRMINILGDNALLLGYAGGRKVISPRMIKECYRETRLKSGKEPASFFSSLRSRFALAGALGILLLGGLTMTDTGRNVLKPGRAVHLQNDGAKKGGPIDKASLLLEDITELKTDRPLQGESGPAPPERGDRAPFKVELTEVNNGGEGQSSAGGDVEKAPFQPRIIMVRKGDTLTGMALSVYGRMDKWVITKIRDANPVIRDIDRLEVGQEILFPFLEAVRADRAGGPSSSRNPDPHP